jgi:short-subunit dehydrogenase involved in D-alanine esterification of teichoic acids
MKILVTGTAGFIGFHLAKKLLERGDEVVGIDNINDYYDVNLDFNKATLEHICPQNPQKDSNWMLMDNDFRKEIIYKLGNFTLLTHNMNSKAKNYDFSRKKEEYKKTLLHITKELSVLDNIDTEYLKNRQEEIVKLIYKDFEV